MSLNYNNIIHYEFEGETSLDESMKLLENLNQRLVILMLQGEVNLLIGIDSITVELNTM